MGYEPDISFTGDNEEIEWYKSYGTVGYKLDFMGRSFQTIQPTIQYILGGLILMQGNDETQNLHSFP